jgi:hypothetical protein
VLRQINDFLGPILLIVFVIIAAATPLIILTFSILNLVRARLHWVIIVVKTIAALVVWSVLTYAVILIFIMVVFSADYPTTTTDDIKTTLIFIGECLIYAAAGFGLIWWVRRTGRSNI